MKNQYFGDINDYFKYGIIRGLSPNQSIPLLLCWMLTPDKDNREGNQIVFYDNPKEWQRYDPELFDSLLDRRKTNNIRKISAIYELLDKANHIDIEVLDNKIERADYFNAVQRMLPKDGLVFFDPDNGMEVKSKPCGRKGSSKYLYWNEVQSVYTKSQSLLVYQHYHRKPHQQFTDDLANQFIAQLGSQEVVSFSTTNVVFFLVPAKPKLFDIQAAKIKLQWADKILVKTHTRN